MAPVKVQATCFAVDLAIQVTLLGAVSVRPPLNLKAPKSPLTLALPTSTTRILVMLLMAKVSAGFQVTPVEPVATVTVSWMIPAKSSALLGMPSAPLPLLVSYRTFTVEILVPVYVQRTRLA